MPPTAVPNWLPNAISSLRMLLIPLWVLFAEWANRAGDDEAAADAMRWWSAAVLLLIGASDILDGWLARRFGLQSPLGETLDAVADKLAQVVLFSYLALRDGPAFAPVPLWFLGLLIGRDALLLAGFLSIRRRHGIVDAEHRLHGKAASVLLFVLLVAYSAGVDDALLRALLFGATALFCVSTALYVRHGIRQFTAARPATG